MASQSQPLLHRTIVVTRPAQQARSLVHALEQQGARVLCFPLLSIAPLPLKPNELAQRQELTSYNAILLTSRNAVVHGLARLPPESLSILRESDNAPTLWAVGKATAQALSSLHLEADRVAPRAHAASLLEQLQQDGVAGKRFLFPCSTEAHSTLPEGLAKAGAEVDRWEVYQPCPAPTDLAPLMEEVEQGRIDVITLASPSTAHILFQREPRLREPEWQSRVAYATIGPTTQKAVLAAGISQVLVADPPGVPGLLSILQSWYS